MRAIDVVLSDVQRPETVNSNLLALTNPHKQNPELGTALRGILEGAGVSLQGAETVEELCEVTANFIANAYKRATPAGLRTALAIVDNLEPLVTSLTRINEFDIPPAQAQARYRDFALRYLDLSITDAAAMCPMGEDKYLKTERLRAHLASCLVALERGVQPFPDEFYERFRALAATYASAHGDRNPFQHIEDSLPYLQLRIFGENPAVLRDDRCIPVLKELSSIKRNPPIHFNQFSEYQLTPDNSSGRYVLRAGFGPEHIPVIGKIVDEALMWPRSAEFTRIFFSNMAELVEHLTPSNRSATLPIRLRLEANVTASEVRFHTLYTHNDPQEIAALEEYLASNKTGSDKERNLASMYLSGLLEGREFGRGIAWFI